MELERCREEVRTMLVGDAEVKSSAAYIRHYYGVNCYVRRPVFIDGRVGQITRCTNYVWVSVDGRRARPYHPTDPAIRYLSDEEYRAL